MKGITVIKKYEVHIGPERSLQVVSEQVSETSFALHAEQSLYFITPDKDEAERVRQNIEDNMRRKDDHFPWIKEVDVPE